MTLIEENDRSGHLTPSPPVHNGKINSAVMLETLRFREEATTVLNKNRQYQHSGRADALFPRRCASLKKRQQLRRLPRWLNARRSSVEAAPHADRSRGAPLAPNNRHHLRDVTAPTLPRRARRMSMNPCHR